MKLKDLIIISTRITPKLKQKFKVICAKKDISMQDKLAELIESVVRKG